MGEKHSKQGYSALNVGLDKVVVMVEQLRGHYRQSDLLRVFDVSRSSIDYRHQRVKQVNPERERLKGLVSRGAARSRTISGMLKQQGVAVGHYKVADKPA